MSEQPSATPVDALAETLRRRAARAAAAATSACAEAAVLTEISTALRDSLLTAHCAWCGAYRLADRWLAEDKIPRCATGTDGLTRVSHSICPACVRTLRASGQSA